ncbi:hypothetical protein H4Q26_003515 [Puccinia striiformis f. sp. tritici PST-130]|nr:hypothetical protein H4Q26_003515 [Puccinia striiformis f. sp. tritici PST-130]
MFRASLSGSGFKYPTTPPLYFLRDHSLDFQRSQHASSASLLIPVSLWCFIGRGLGSLRDLDGPWLDDTSLSKTSDGLKRPRELVIDDHRAPPEADGQQISQPTLHLFPFQQAKDDHIGIIVDGDLHRSKHTGPMNTSGDSRRFPGDPFIQENNHLNLLWQ